MKWMNIALGVVLAVGCAPELRLGDEASSSTGSGGMGGGVGGASCEPGAVSFCYSGPASTEGIGTCQQGVQVCNNAGNGYGECVNEVTPKVEDCATQADENCDGRTTCSGAYLWSKLFGDKSAQLATNLAVDANGNVFTTGYMNGTVDFGNGPLTSAGGMDIFVDKVDTAGNPLWSKRFGDASDWQLGESIAVDSAGNVVVAGEFGGAVDFGNGPLMSAGPGSRAIFVAKFDAKGNLRWSKRLGDAGSGFYLGIIVAIAIDGSGNIVVTGEFGGTVDFGKGPLTSAGGADVFVAKFDPMGIPLWSKRFGDGLNQQAHSIAINTNGSMVITGDFGGAVDFGNGSLVSAGSSDIFVVKFDAEGNPSWSKRLGGASYDAGVGVALDASQNVFVTGKFEGTVDFGSGPLMSAGGNDIFVVKLNTDGNPLWSKRFGDASVQTVWAIAADGAGNVLVTGSFQGAVDFGSGLLISAGSDDGFIAKLDRTGAPLWSKRFGDAAYQAGRGVAVDSTGNVLLTGVADGTIDLGGGPLTSAGNWDIFLAKLAP